MNAQPEQRWQEANGTPMLGDSEVRQSLSERMFAALIELSDIYAGVDDGDWSPEDADEIRAEYKQIYERDRKKGVRALSRSMRERIGTMQDATRHGEGYKITRQVLEKWKINLEILELDPMDTAIRSIARGWITSDLNYYLCRTILDAPSDLDTNEHERLDQVLQKYEQKWGA